MMPKYSLLNATKKKKQTLEDLKIPEKGICVITNGCRDIDVSDLRFAKLVLKMSSDPNVRQRAFSRQKRVRIEHFLLSVALLTRSYIEKEIEDRLQWKLLESDIRKTSQISDTTKREKETSGKLCS